MFTRSNALVLSAMLFVSAVPAVLADDAAQPAAATKAEKPVKTKKAKAPKQVAQKAPVEAPEGAKKSDAYVPYDTQSELILGE